MVRRLMIAATLSAFGFVAIPVIGHEAGVMDIGAAADMDATAKKKKTSKAKSKPTQKYQYQYVPTSSGRPGAWR